MMQTERTPLHRTVNPLYLTDWFPERNLDSVAVHYPGPGLPASFYVTDKAGACILKFNLADGGLVDIFSVARHIRRPNGISVSRSRMYVTDTTGNGLAVFQIRPDRIEFVFRIEHNLLRRPYGVAACGNGPTDLLYVTGSVGSGTVAVPILLFSVSRSGVYSALERFVRVCRHSSGWIGKTESICRSPDGLQLFVADEKEGNIKVYDARTLAFTDRVFGSGIFDGEPEGICVCRAAGRPKAWYWICADQNPGWKKNGFVVVDGPSGTHVATVNVRDVDNTDGVCCGVRNAAEPRRTEILLVLNSDRQVAAVDVNDVLPRMEATT